MKSKEKLIELAIGHIHSLMSLNKILLVIDESYLEEIESDLNYLLEFDSKEEV
jgi:hypothetical protein